MTPIFANKPMHACRFVSLLQGFSSALYAFFRDQQGNPRTPRDDFGLPNNGFLDVFRRMYVSRQMTRMMDSIIYNNV